MNERAASHRAVTGCTLACAGTRSGNCGCFYVLGVNMRTAEQYGLDDSAVQAMGRAFDIACARLSRTGIMLPGNLDRLQKIAAQQLVMYARNGERNEWRLARRAIFAVCAAVAGERIAAGLAAAKP